mmetsp:Transcript_15415/g.11223  ORF Transcript_15415/g.11223 Transcript_15415/m.11223 type:complete len:292 (+) Transcript_15415:3-878(+)
MKDDAMDAMSLACKSLDSAMEEYNRMKMALNWSANAHVPASLPQARSARGQILTQQMCQQALKRSNNTTVLSSAVVANLKESEKEMASPTKVKSMTLKQPQMKRASTPFTAPKPTKSSSLLLASLSTRSHDSYESTSPSTSQKSRASQRSSLSTKRTSLSSTASAAFAAALRPFFSQEEKPLNDGKSPEFECSSSNNSSVSSPCATSSRKSLSPPTGKPSIKLQEKKPVKASSPACNISSTPFLSSSTSSAKTENRASAKSKDVIVKLTFANGRSSLQSPMNAARVPMKAF